MQIMTENGYRDFPCVTALKAAGKASIAKQRARRERFKEAITMPVTDTESHKHKTAVMAAIANEK